MHLQRGCNWTSVKRGALRDPMDIVGSQGDLGLLISVCIGIISQLPAKESSRPGVAKWVL